MTESKEPVMFEFGWLALKLLGKSLYSNTWSAISELVANGFDAKAESVYLYIDAQDKRSATIEIFDNGEGMDVDGVNKYARIGYDRRKDAAENDSTLVMGRKGIGKLAALYLSEDYYIWTKTNSETQSIWQMKYTENLEDKHQLPSLLPIDKLSVANKELWDKFPSGTLLRLDNVNLTGLGEQAFKSLENKLSNMFSFNLMHTKKIMFCANDGTLKKQQFHKIEKKVAFGNMAFIEYSNSDALKNMLLLETKEIVQIPFPTSAKLKERTFEHKVELSHFEDATDVKVTGDFSWDDANGDQITVPYSLTGWIGLHSTVDIKTAEKNDPRFSKNQFYNPIQLRLYVRNKLAVENCLELIRNNQAFVNYIEGEISFDILDDNSLPDIATSNRQALDEHDERTQLLISIVRPIVQNLITKRNNLNKIIKGKLINAKNEAKAQFAKEVNEELDNAKDILAPEKGQELAQIIVNKIQGEVEPKEDYIVFISHSRNDKPITDFIYNYLIGKGAKKNEIFYTSSSDTEIPITGSDLEIFQDQIRRNIIQDNALIVYYTTPNYLSSQYCLFEGGAGWATRAKGDYCLFAYKHEDIPEFLDNKQRTLEVSTLQSELTQEAYTYFRNLLATLCDHINTGRKIAGKELLVKPKKIEFPGALELSDSGKCITDYMDEDILKSWNFSFCPQHQDYHRLCKNNSASYKTWQKNLESFKIK